MNLLTLASCLGYRQEMDVLVGGMCGTDFSGYPGCRDNTIKSQQITLPLGLGRRVTIETPLMWLDKAATWRLAEEPGGAGFVDLIVKHTHACYLGEHGARHGWEHGCNACPACELRHAGWERWAGEALAA